MFVLFPSFISQTLSRLDLLRNTKLLLLKCFKMLKPAVWVVRKQAGLHFKLRHRTAMRRKHMLSHIHTYMYKHKSYHTRQSPAQQKGLQQVTSWVSEYSTKFNHQRGRFWRLKSPAVTPHWDFSPSAEDTRTEAQDQQLLLSQCSSPLWCRHPPSLLLYIFLSALNLLVFSLHNGEFLLYPSHSTHLFSVAFYSPPTNPSK